MYTAQQVATEGGIAVRTLYWYVKVGVVPPPLGAGRGSRWTDEHVRAVRAVRRDLHDYNRRLADLPDLWHPAADDEDAP